MDILFLLIPLSLLFVALIAWLLIWAVRSGQYEDLDRPGPDILMDDDRPDSPPSDSAEKSGDQSP